MPSQKPIVGVPARPQKARHDTAAEKLSTNLSSKPQRGRRRGGQWQISSVLLMLVAVLLVGLLVFFAFKLFAIQASAPSASTSNSGSNKNVCLQGQTCSSGQNAPIMTQPDFAAVVESQVAQGLHLSADQLKTQLQTGLQITDLAQQQGLSLTQWHTLELNAVQAGMEKLIGEGKLTQTMANSELQRWRTNPDSMDSSIEFMLGGCPPQPAGVSSCPTGQPGKIGN